MLENKEVLIWLKRAEDDLIAAKAIVEQKAPAWVACFHCQQTGEKALKAAQIYFLKDFQKEHDLEVLLNSLKKHLEIEAVLKEAKELTDYYVATRYPGIEESELILDDAHSAIKSAEKILGFIRTLVRK